MPPEPAGVGRGGGIAARLTFLSETAPAHPVARGAGDDGDRRHGDARPSRIGGPVAAGLAEGTFGRILDVCVAFLIGALPLLGAAQQAGDHAGALAIWRRGCGAALLLGGACLLLGLSAGPLFALAGQPPALAATAGRDGGDPEPRRGVRARRGGQCGVSRRGCSGRRWWRWRCCSPISPILPPIRCSSRAAGAFPPWGPQGPRW